MRRPPGRHVGRLLTLVAVLAIGGTVEAEDNQPKAQSPALLLETRCDVFDRARQECLLWGPSLLELITRPEIYDGRRVRVIGWVDFAFENTALYLSQSDSENGLTRNAVWVDPPPGFGNDWGPTRPQPNRRYVIMEGTFRAKRRGHLNLFSGALENVTRLEQWR